MSAKENPPGRGEPAPGGGFDVRPDTGAGPATSQGGFVALHRTEAAAELQRCHPKAFLLLALIARRARYRPEPNPINGLKHGEALIGDFKAAGLTRAAYRHAQKTLIATGLATFRATTKGTVAALLDARVFSIGSPSNNHQSDHKHSHRTTIEQPSNSHRTTIEQPLSNQGNSDNSDYSEHHGTIKSTHTGGGEVRRPTLAQAREAAPMVGVTPEQAEEWWHTREANDWMKGTAGGGTTPVGQNWQSDMKVMAPKLKNRTKRNEPRTDNGAGDGIAPKSL